MDCSWANRSYPNRGDPRCPRSPLTFVLVLLVANTAASQQCIDYKNYLRWMGAVDTPGAAVGVAISGDLVCVADRTSGLQVIDVANPASPRIVGTVDTPGDASDVAISGRYAYVADESSGLQIVDLIDPASPRI